MQRQPKASSRYRRSLLGEVDQPSPSSLGRPLGQAKKSDAIVSNLATYDGLSRARKLHAGALKRMAPKRSATGSESRSRLVTNPTTTCSGDPRVPNLDAAARAPDPTTHGSFARRPSRAPPPTRAPESAIESSTRKAATLKAMASEEPLPTIRSARYSRILPKLASQEALEHERRRRHPYIVRELGIAGSPWRPVTARHCSSNRSRMRSSGERSVTRIALRGPRW